MRTLYFCIKMLCLINLLSLQLFLTMKACKSNNFMDCLEAITKATRYYIILYNKCINLIQTEKQDKQMRQVIMKIAYCSSRFNQQKDYYKILNVNNKASEKEIKQSYKTLVKKYHPDINVGKEELFKEVNEAYQVLSDQSIKKQYDEVRNQREPQGQAHRQNEKQRAAYEEHHRRSSYEQQHKRSSYQQTYKERRGSDSYGNNDKQSEEYRNDQEIRDHIRRKQEEQMRRYEQNRKKHGGFGTSYENYERFRQETEGFKAQKHHQKDKVTQESVKKQQQLRRQYQDRVSKKQWQQKKAYWQKQLKSRYQRAMDNNRQGLDGFRRVGQYLKNALKKK